MQGQVNNSVTAPFFIAIPSNNDLSTLIIIISCISGLSWTFGRLVPTAIPNPYAWSIHRGALQAGSPAEHYILLHTTQKAQTNNAGILYEIVRQ